MRSWGGKENEWKEMCKVCSSGGGESGREKRGVLCAQPQFTFQEHDVSHAITGHCDTTILFLFDTKTMPFFFFALFHATRSAREPFRMSKCRCTEGPIYSVVMPLCLIACQCSHENDREIANCPQEA